MECLIKYRVTKDGSVVKEGLVKVKKAANEFHAKMEFGRMIERKHPDCILEILECQPSNFILDFFNKNIFK